MIIMRKIVTFSSLPYEVKIESSINVSGYDGILFISSGKAGNDGPEPLPSIIAKAIKVNKKMYLLRVLISSVVMEVLVNTYLVLLQLDKATECDGAVVEVPLPAERLIYVPVVLNLDIHDVRSFKDSGKKAISR